MQMDLKRWLISGVEAIEEWQATFAPFEADQSLYVSDDEFAKSFSAFTKLLEGNYPFFHPSYAGQMIKPPHPAAIVGYLTAMLVNPNNHALDGGPPTARMEKEVVAQLAQMFGLTTSLGHLTTSGTIANLEALYIAREIHPHEGVAYSEEAHYTHSRMCKLLGVRGTPVPVDSAGRMDLAALDELLAKGQHGTVVATVGTTGLGSIDPVHQILDVARRHRVRVHVDAAYGGFFTLLTGRDDLARLDDAPWRAIAECDSVVVDPHKHGLQPYGCGAVLFRDPEVARFYQHDSPYTYYTSEELHLGEISLECSRAGAAAAALWLTFQLLPPTAEGLGGVLAAGRRAALKWAQLLNASDRLELYQQPELDIVTYFPATHPNSLSAIDRASEQMLHYGIADMTNPVYISTLEVSTGAFTGRHQGVTADKEGARILRSVLMKPEAENHVAELHSRIEQLADS